MGGLALAVHGVLPKFAAGFTLRALPVDFLAGRERSCESGGSHMKTKKANELSMYEALNLINRNFGQLRQAPGLSSWLAQLLDRAHQNVVIVALANKLLRMAWIVTSRLAGESVAMREGAV